MKENRLHDDDNDAHEDGLLTGKTYGNDVIVTKNVTMIVLMMLRMNVMNNALLNCCILSEKILSLPISLLSQ